MQQPIDQFGGHETILIMKQKKTQRTRQNEERKWVPIGGLVFFFFFLGKKNYSDLFDGLAVGFTRRGFLDRVVFMFIFFFFYLPPFVVADECCGRGAPGGGGGGVRRRRWRRRRRRRPLPSPPEGSGRFDAHSGPNEVPVAFPS